MKITISKTFRNIEKAKKWLLEKKVVPTDYEKKSGQVKIKVLN